jgi:hypothetical protein
VEAAKGRGVGDFSEVDHAAASALSAVVHTGLVALPPQTTCVPLLIGCEPVAGDGQVFSFGSDGRYLSVAPAQQLCLMAEAASHVFPAEALSSSWAVGFVVYVQVVEVAVGGISASAAAPVPPERPIAVKLLPREVAERDEGPGQGAVGCLLATFDGRRSFVIAPVGDPARTVLALDDLAWVGADLGPAVLSRLVDPDRPLLPLDLALPAGLLYVQGWVARVLAACERNGPSHARVLRVVSRPPDPVTVERMTAERLLAAATSGRIPCPLSRGALAWAGTDLGMLALAGHYRSLRSQLDELAGHDPALAAQVTTLVRTRYGLDSDLRAG